MNSILKDELLSLFNQKNYSSVVNQALNKQLTPEADPSCGNIVAASLFQLSKFDDCLLWCEALSPSFAGDPAFASMYGAVLRRLNRLDEGLNVFQQALVETPDNQPLLNNYANLLIDMQRYKEAKKILLSVLSINSDYEDARVNLERVNFFLDSIVSPSPSINSSSSKTDVQKLSVLDDPLSFAFSDEEVAKAGGLPIKKQTSHPSTHKHGLLDTFTLDQIASRSDDKELTELIQLIRSTSKYNSSQALSDLTSLHKAYGSKAFIHELASEVFIHAKSFDLAERHALIALQLGSNSPSLYLNLANLSFMRGDELLAVHWIEHTASHFPDYDQLEAVKNNLIKNGIPSKSKSPFSLS